MSMKLDGLGQDHPVFSWKKMPYHSCETLTDFMASAARLGGMSLDTDTKDQIDEARAHHTDKWIWEGCKKSKQMAEWYDTLRNEVHKRRTAWIEFVSESQKATDGKVIDLSKEVDKLRAAVAGERDEDESSVNTKSISGDTSDDAASLTSEPIHKRLDHSDK